MLPRMFRLLGRCRSLAAVLTLAFVLQGVAVASMSIGMSSTMVMIETRGTSSLPCPDCPPAQPQDCISLCAQNTGLLSLDQVATMTLQPVPQRPSYWPFILSLHEPFAQPPPVPPIVA